MLFNLIALFIINALAIAHPVEQSGPYSVKEAASIARTLVSRESLTQFNTVQQSGPFEGWPVSFVEYYSDCNQDGNPFMLMIDISTDFQNVAEGSKLSLSIKVGDHQLKDHSNPHYPGGIVSSTMGSPRVMLTGSFVNVTEQYSIPEILSISKCFVSRHHDSAWWLPGSKIHSSHWWQFKVEGVYFIGGFGDRAYIGEIPIEEYQNAELLDDSEYTNRLHEMYNYHHPHHASAHLSSYHHKEEPEQIEPELSIFSKILNSFQTQLF